MRTTRWLLLGTAAIALAAGPALAGRMERRDRDAREFRPGFAESNGLAALELHSRLVRRSEFGARLSERRRRDLGLLVDDGPGVLDGYGYGYAAPAAPPVIVLDREPAPRPVPSAHISVETTPSGVQIVRGPGSRHVAR